MGRCRLPSRKELNQTQFGVGVGSVLAADSAGTCSSYLAGRLGTRENSDCLAQVEIGIKDLLFP